MRRVLWAAAVALLVAAALFWRWEHPARVLSRTDVDGYLRAIDAGAQLPDDEKRDLLARLRAWGEADDVH